MALISRVFDGDQSSENYLARICEVNGRISELAAGRNLKVTPFTTLSQMRFVRLPVDVQRTVFENVRRYVHVLEKSPLKSAGEGIELHEEVTCLQTALHEFNLESTDTFWYLSQGDIIEIYSIDHVQLYRNFEFFRQCSYDLLTLVTVQWPELYERAQKHTDQIFASVQHTLDIGRTQAYSMDTHIMRERYLDAKRVFSNRMKYLVPLTDGKTKKIAGYINTVDSRLVIEGTGADKLSYF
jgi:hypothetical protein